MTSATVKHARGASRDDGYGLVVFAAMLLGIIAVDVVALWGLCAYGSRERLGT